MKGVLNTGNVDILKILTDRHRFLAELAYVLRQFQCFAPDFVRRDPWDAGRAAPFLQIHDREIPHRFDSDRLEFGWPCLANSRHLPMLQAIVIQDPIDQFIGRLVRLAEINRRSSCDRLFFRPLRVRESSLKATHRLFRIVGNFDVVQDVSRSAHSYPGLPRGWDARDPVDSCEYTSIAISMGTVQAR